MISGTRLEYNIRQILVKYVQYLNLVKVTYYLIYCLTGEIGRILISEVSLVEFQSDTSVMTNSDCKLEMM